MKNGDKVFPQSISVVMETTVFRLADANVVTSLTSGHCSNVLKPVKCL